MIVMILTLVTMIMTLVTMIMTESAVQSSDILVSDLPNQRVPRACCGPVPSQGRKDDHPHHFDRHHRRDHDDHHSNDIFTNPLLSSMLKLKFWMLSIWCSHQTLNLWSNISSFAHVPLVWLVRKWSLEAKGGTHWRRRIIEREGWQLGEGRRGALSEGWTKRAAIATVVFTKIILCVCALQALSKLKSKTWIHLNSQKLIHSKGFEETWTRECNQSQVLEEF